jgi:hypothetical protein
VFEVIQMLLAEDAGSSYFDPASSSNEELMVWLGRKVRIYGLESNNLCRAVFSCWRYWVNLGSSDNSLGDSSEDSLEDSLEGSLGG